MNRVDAKKLNFSLIWPQHFLSTLLWILFANFRRACTGAFLNRQTLRALHNFSPLRRIVLLMVILVTVIPAALRTSTRSCCVTLRCSLAFLIIRFTLLWEILYGAADWGRLIFSWSYLPNPSARTGYDTRSILKRSLTGLNSEVSFS